MWTLYDGFCCLQFAVGTLMEDYLGMRVFLFIACYMFYCMEVKVCLSSVCLFECECVLFSLSVCVCRSCLCILCTSAFVCLFT